MNSMIFIETQKNKEHLLGLNCADTADMDGCSSIDLWGLEVKSKFVIS